jgi:hypothetical protein
VFCVLPFVIFFIERRAWDAFPFFRLCRGFFSFRMCRRCTVLLTNALYDAFDLFVVWFFDVSAVAPMVCVATLCCVLLKIMWSWQHINLVSLAFACSIALTISLQAIVDRAAQLNIAVSNPMGRLRKEEHA